jgi:acid phosphatase type 7
VIDHGGPNGGLRGALQHGKIGDDWKPATCDGTVPIATGALDAEWGEDTYGTIDKSPHAVHASWGFATDTSLAAIWETDRGTHATYLAYGTSPGKLDHFVQGVTFVNPDTQDGPVIVPVLIHETHVCGLTPDTTYYYAVGGDGWYGNVYSVKTGPPIASKASFRFTVVGDSNAFYWLFAQVAAKMATFAPDWMLFTGDLVNSGFSQFEWEQWFAAAGPFVAHVPTMTVHGNHEDMATGYFALFALPDTEQFYSFDYGNTHFVVLNDSPPPGETLTGRQATFLDSDLAAAEARPTPPRWYVTSHHRPMFASDPGEGSNLTVRAAWQRIYEKHHTDVDMNGHDHHFEMTTPILGDATATSGGIRYITSAGGGALFDEPTPVANPWSIAYYAGLSFAVVDVDDASMKITGYRTDGTTIHSILLTK